MKHLLRVSCVCVTLLPMGCESPVSSPPQPRATPPRAIPTALKPEAPPPTPPAGQHVALTPTHFLHRPPPHSVDHHHVEGPPQLNQAALQARLSNHTSGVVLVHVWATWCPPCTTEWPQLKAFVRAMAPLGITVLALSVDDHAHAHDFAPFTTALPDAMTVRRWAHAEGEDLATLLDPKWDGTLPATFAYLQGTQRAALHGPFNDAVWRRRLMPLLTPSVKHDAGVGSPGR